MGKVKVIGSSTSLFCTRIEWALKLKGVDYEYMEENLLNKSPYLLKYNPVHKKVPVLVHEDKPIAESLVILEYIDETWKDCPLFPQDPYDRAMARFWAKFADEKCVFGAWGACKAEGEEKEKAIEAAKETLAFLEKQIEGKKFFNGEKIGFLDLVVGWVPLWLGVLEQVGGMKLLEPETYPALHEWSQKFMDIPLIKNSMPPRDKVVHYFEGGLAYLRSLAAKNNP